MWMSVIRNTVMQPMRNPNRVQTASVAAVMFVGLMLLQQQTQVKNELMPIEIADAVPSEYLAAHQTYAPNSAAYYIQNASYADQK